MLVNPQSFIDVEQAFAAPFKLYDTTTFTSDYMITIKKIITIILLLLAPFSSLCENRAYKTISEIKFYDGDQGGKKPIRTIAKGDTLYATSETDTYLLEHEEQGFNSIPLEYNGIRGFAYTSSIYPIKLSETDHLVFIQDSAPKSRVVQERYLVPYMEWAMNLPFSHMSWIYILFAAIAVGVVSFVLMMGPKKLYYPSLILMGLSLVAASAAEIMYLLCFHEYVLWFIYPSVVGGWGHTILNFIVMSVVLAIQMLLFYFMWRQSFLSEFNDDTLEIKNNTDDDDDDDSQTPSWINKLAFLPILLGLALMVLIWVDFFSGNTLSLKPYVMIGGILVVAALCGLAYQFYNKRILQGIVYPMFYITGGVGIAASVMILGMVVVLVAVAGILFGLLAMTALAGIGGVLFGVGKSVRFKDEYGRTHYGTQNLDGTIKGDDGNTYIAK